MKPADWIPLWVGLAVGLVGGSLIIALGLGRPMSRLRRLGYVALGLGVFVLSPAVGFWLILMRVIVEVPH